MLQNKSETCVMSVTSMSFRSFYFCTWWQRLTGTARKRERKWYETVCAWIFLALHWEDKNGFDALKWNLIDATTETNLSSFWCRGQGWNVGDGKRSNPVRGKRNTSRSDRERLCWKSVFFSLSVERFSVRCPWEACFLSWKPLQCKGSWERHL